MSARADREKAQEQLGDELVARISTTQRGRAGCVLLVPSPPDDRALRLLETSVGKLSGSARLSRPFPEEYPRLFVLSSERPGADTPTVLDAQCRDLEMLAKETAKKLPSDFPWKRSSALFNKVLTFDYRDGVDVDNYDKIAGLNRSDVMQEPLQPAGGDAVQFPKEELEYLASFLRLEVPGGLEAVAATVGSEADPVQRFVDGVDSALREPAEVLGTVALRMAQLDFIKSDLDRLAGVARSSKITWSDIGRAAGITPQAAQRRWSPDARKKHSDYQRDRARRAQGRSSDS